MNLIYERTIAVMRAGDETAVGAVSYAGVTKDSYQPVTGLSGLSASVQELSSRGGAPEGLPTDGRKVLWKIHFIIPGQQATPGLIKDLDVIVDDEGIRYQVIAARWTLLNWQCTAERLEK